GQDPQIRASRRRQTAICRPAASSDGIDAYDFGCLIEAMHSVNSLSRAARRSRPRLLIGCAQYQGLRQTERSTFRSGAMKFGAMVVPRASDWRLVVELEQMGYDSAWPPDSQMIYSDTYAVMYLKARLFTLALEA